MSTPNGEAEVAALAEEAGVSHEAARHALIMNMLYASVRRAREAFFRDHGRTHETEAAWNRGMTQVLGVAP